MGLTPGGLVRSMSSIYGTIGKRILDVVLSATVLLLTLPVILIVALLVRAALGSPVCFTQQRPGLHGRPFVLYKFRSMTDARGPDGEPLGDEARLTALRCVAAQARASTSCRSSGTC